MVEGCRRIILYGDSLILEGVRASLETFPGLEILVLDQSEDLPLKELRRLNPAAVIFDLEGISRDFPIAILQQPGLLLVGIDPAGDHMLLWSGENSRVVSMQDLVQAIDGEAAAVRHAGRGAPPA